MLPLVSIGMVSFKTGTLYGRSFKFVKGGQLVQGGQPGHGFGGPAATDDLGTPVNMSTKIAESRASVGRKTSNFSFITSISLWLFGYMVSPFFPVVRWLVVEVRRLRKLFIAPVFEPQANWH